MPKIVKHSRRTVLPMLCSLPVVYGCASTTADRPVITATSGRRSGEIVQNFIPNGRRNRPGTTISPEWVTIHSTSNTARTADASAHARFLNNTGAYRLNSGRMNWVSWHYTVDDKSIIQHLPLNEKGYHCGAGNSESVGIEICMNEGANFEQAIRQAAYLAAKFCFDKNLPLSSVVQHHYWTTKNCPILLREATYSDISWTQFLEYLGMQMNVLTNGTPRTPRNIIPPSLVNADNEPDIDHEALKGLIG